jgi:hypothetical protein
MLVTVLLRHAAAVFDCDELVDAQRQCIWGRVLLLCSRNCWHPGTIGTPPHVLDGGSGRDVILSETRC